MKKKNIMDGVCFIGMVANHQIKILFKLVGGKMINRMEISIIFILIQIISGKFFALDGLKMVSKQCLFNKIKYTKCLNFKMFFKSTDIIINI